MNGYLKLLIGLLVALILWAYGYAFINGEAVKAVVEKRLERIEAKLDLIMERFYREMSREERRR